MNENYTLNEILSAKVPSHLNLTMADVEYLEQVKAQTISDWVLSKYKWPEEVAPELDASETD